ncbi:MAG: DEAD/DEAH box helicase [Lachnospirales bacterium]
MEKFTDIFDENIIKYLDENNIKEPTKIQKNAIPMLLEDNNIFFTAQTGSGKTLTYLLPLIKKYKDNVKTPQAIVIAPTQDLAIQIYNVAKNVLSKTNLPEPLLAAGGTSLKRQLDGLKAKPFLIIGTQSRVLQLNTMKKLKLHTVDTIVFDECDKMLDKLNFDETTTLVKKCMRDTNLVFTSASTGLDTLNKIKLLRPTIKTVEVDKNDVPNNIKHYYIICDSRDKIDTLRRSVTAFNIDKALVFINKDVEITSLSAKLSYVNLPSTFIDGELKGNERKVALNSFKNNKVKLLVASDLASRGLDIKNLKFVVNYSAPSTYEQYLHRCGRCGRAGGEGIVLTICDSKDFSYIKKYRSRLNIDIQEVEFRKGDVVIK